jgi:hypothetical protein
MKYDRAKLSEHFWSKVVKTKTCWLFAPSANTKYRNMRIGTTMKDKRKKATHVSWFLHYGVWPEKQICHHCDNPICIRPSHLFDGDQAANIQDMVAKGRASGGGAYHKKFEERWS